MMKQLKWLLTFFLLVTFQLGGAQSFSLTSSGYFKNANVDVMAFSDIYPEGHQGGITLVMNDNRIAAAGDVRMEPTPGQWQGLPKMRSRVVNDKERTITIQSSFPDSLNHLAGFNPMLYTDFQFNYTVKVKAENDRIIVTIDLDKPVPAKYVGKIGFNLDLFPGFLFGKPWIMDAQTGVFPRQAIGPTIKQVSNTTYPGNYNPKGKASLKTLTEGVYNPMVADDIIGAPMAQGRMFVLNPEEPLYTVTVQSEKGDLKLYDGRMNHANGWFVLRSDFAAGGTTEVAKWIITPKVSPEWKYTPVVQTSQIGYHPNQPKIAYIELDSRETNILTPILYKVTSDGLKEVLKTPAASWGKFLRYNYLKFDFSSIKEEGMYQVQYGNSRSSCFRIAKDVYDKGAWQAELEYFLPIMMCHMRVNEKYRVWHGLCHEDDAKMAPVNLNHFDGYSQGPSTLTKYQPGEEVPGLTIGGWHDAGDYDLRVESQASESYILAMAYENFNVNYDETSIDQHKRITEIHQPDGKNDILQQVENGALSVVAGYKALGRLYRGIICNKVRQYVHLGDAATDTDNKMGNDDDRWVFTEDNPYRELSTAAQLAAISRVLKNFNDTLSAQCLQISEELYAKTKGEGWATGAKLEAAVELFLTTGEKTYKDFVLSQQNFITDHIQQTGWFIGRFDKAVGNKKFTKAVRAALPKVRDSYDRLATESPYGVSPNHGNTTSGSWDVQSTGFRYCFLQDAYPDLFKPDFIYNSVHFILGCHPGSNTSSFVTGVGAKTMTAAYGVNRADWSYIPGGVSPGTVLIRPDLPELYHFPFLWQEGEYCMGGEASYYMYMVLASKKILNQ